MSEKWHGGKGSAPRPKSVDEKVYADNWARIFEKYTPTPSPFVCVLRSGGEYKAQHAIRLYDMARRAGLADRFLCLSDVDVPGVPCQKLTKPRWFGWWSKFEAMEQARYIQEDGSHPAGIWMCDLDTTFISLPDEPTETTACDDFYGPQRFGSGFMWVSWSDMGEAYRTFESNAIHWMMTLKIYPDIGDQALLYRVWGDRVRRWPREQVVSYKLDVKGGVAPAGARVVCFHGHPRPWHAPEVRWP